MRLARENLGISQRELARRCGISEAQIGKYEKGTIDPSSTYLRNIAEVLGVSTDYLVGLTDNPLDHLGSDQISESERELLNSFRREGWAGVAHLLAEQFKK